MADDSKMDCHVKARFRVAAHHARRAYPGPIGELLAREILSWEQWGHRLGGEGLMTQVVDQVLSKPVARGAA